MKETQWKWQKGNIEAPIKIGQGEKDQGEAGDRWTDGQAPVPPSMLRLCSKELKSGTRCVLSDWNISPQFLGVLAADSGNESLTWRMSPHINQQPIYRDIT